MMMLMKIIPKRKRTMWKRTYEKKRSHRRTNKKIVGKNIRCVGVKSVLFAIKMPFLTKKKKKKEKERCLAILVRFMEVRSAENFSAKRRIEWKNKREFSLPFLISLFVWSTLFFIRGIKVGNKSSVNTIIVHSESPTYVNTCRVCFSRHPRSQLENCIYLGTVNCPDRKVVKGEVEHRGREIDR